MYQKTCPYCNGKSYSASVQGEWRCPYCLADLSGVIPYPPVNDEESKNAAVNKPLDTRSKIVNI
ncbi:MAG: hypothetical protein K9L17_07820 [Clostridiales bacterium]|nr:hypothetical protein [Clostridiales bacterium]MCF8022580.1 hypothetical protein [Clostridiales bacterium]